jgi:murein DD-endopeptidase MepM/ murein hydrolase activator NlpD
MAKKLCVAALAFLMLGPSLLLLAIGVLVNPAANAACTTTGGGVQVANAPESLTVTTKDGTTFTLNHQQLTHAATIITVGSTIDGVNRDGLQIAIMAALTESTLRMLANTSAYPDSAHYPHDGNGSDHDSLGLFQMRPAAGWGSVKDLMDPAYQVRAFFGGPTGPNYPSPRGLLDIRGWQTMDKGAAAQAVEVSAYPDRYRNFEPVARTILDTLTTPSRSSNSGGAGARIPETSRIVFPLPAGTWVMTSAFGPRIHPITGQRTHHSGTDYAAPDGTAIFAVADGVVARAQYTDSGGGLIVIDHTIDGQAISTDYRHMWRTGIHVAAGDRVSAGQHIGDVGSSGMSTGPHLHLKVRPTGGTSIDAGAWLAEHAAVEHDAAGAGASAGGCTPGGYAGAATPITGDGGRMVDDPTTGGRITSRMAQVMAQTRAAFPDTSWSCYSPRPGTKSEHPLGRACDVTFGNAIGHYPTPSQLNAGWQVTNWLKDNAETLGVEYLIWQGTVWSLARDSQGWRAYNGGGMHDPRNVTGGHFDHLHITVKT